MLSFFQRGHSSHQVCIVDLMCNIMLNQEGIWSVLIVRSSKCLLLTLQYKKKGHITRAYSIHTQYGIVFKLIAGGAAAEP